MHPYIHCNIIYNNQDVEATEVSTKRTDKDKWKKKTQWNITQP